MGEKMVTERCTPTKDCGGPPCTYPNCAKGQGNVVILEPPGFPGGVK